MNSEKGFLNKFFSRVEDAGWLYAIMEKIFISAFSIYLQFREVL